MNSIHRNLFKSKIQSVRTCQFPAVRRIKKCQLRLHQCPLAKCKVRNNRYSLNIQQQSLAMKLLHEDFNLNGIRSIRGLATKWTRTSVCVLPAQHSGSILHSCLRIGKKHSQKLTKHSQSENHVKSMTQFHSNAEKENICFAAIE